MAQEAYRRPFVPAELASASISLFDLPGMIQQLTTEEAFNSGGRSSLTLLHERGLTVVLTGARKETRCDDHHQSSASLIISLSGAVTITPTGGKPITLSEGCAAALAAGVEHRIAADSDCAFLAVIGVH